VGNNVIKTWSLGYCPRQHFCRVALLWNGRHGAAWL